MIILAGWRTPRTKHGVPRFITEPQPLHISIYNDVDNDDDDKNFAITIAVEGSVSQSAPNDICTPGWGGRGPDIFTFVPNLNKLL